MPTWLGVNGDINNPANYEGPPVDTGALYQNIGLYGHFGAFFFNTAIDLTNADLLFGPALVVETHGPTKPPPISDTNQPGVVSIAFAYVPTNNSKPPNPPPTLLQQAASYKVTGGASIDSAVVGSGTGQTVTLAGALTLTGASNSPMPALEVAGGAANVTGQLTVQTYGEVDDETLSVGGKANFAGLKDPTFGQVSLALFGGTLNIVAGGSVSTAGVLVNLAVEGSSNSQLSQVKVAGTLTDTDKTVGLQIGGGGDGILAIKPGGVVNSVIATLGGSDGSAGTAKIIGGGIWKNSGTLVVDNDGTLTVQGEVDSGEVTLDGTATVSGGTLTISNANGDLTVTKSGTLKVSASGVVNALLLRTMPGSNVSFDEATLSDASSGAPTGNSGAMLNGNVDFSNTKVTETATNAAIVVGYADGKDTTLTTYVTATNATVVTNTTTISAGVSSGPTDADLIISGGSWTDQGTGTTMTVGDGSASYLGLSDRAHLVDQDATVGTPVAKSGAPTLAVAHVGNGSTWTVKGNLTVGSLHAGNLDAIGGSTVSVGGALSIDVGSGGASVVTIDSSTLTAGGTITLGGKGVGNLTVSSGTVTDSSGPLVVTKGNLSVSGMGGLVKTTSLMLNGVEALASIGQGATLDAGSQTATLAAGSELTLAGGVLLAGSIYIKSLADIIGFGTIGEPGSMTTGVTMNGSGIYAFGDNGADSLLSIAGYVNGGTINIYSNAEVSIAGTIHQTAVMFNGTGGVLNAMNASPIGGPVSGFVKGDAIDVEYVGNSATWAGGTLTVYEGPQVPANVVTQFALAGNYQNTQFAVTPIAGVYSEITITSNGPAGAPGVTGATPSAPLNPRIDLAASVSVAPIVDAAASSVTATVTDLTGALGAAASGSATVEDNGSVLVVTGSVADVNATLATLTYQPTIPGTDTIWVGVLDDQGGASYQSTTVTVADPGVTADVPGAQSIVAGSAVAIAGVAIGDLLTDPSLTYSVTLGDTWGLLAATQEGAATVTGAGSISITVSGDLTSIDRTLATLTYTGLVGGSGPATDTIDLKATDQFGGAATASIGVAIAQPPVPTQTAWAADDDGDASVAANWTSGVPNTGITADAPSGNYTIAGPVDAGKFIVEGSPTFTGSVTATGLSGDYQTFVADDDGGATFDGGTLDTPSVILAGSSGDTGALKLIDGAQATLSGNGPIGFADAAYLGLAATTEGVLTVSGATLAAATGLSIGDDGAGVLDVDDGGIATTGTAGGGYADVTLGYGSSGSGVLHVDGAGSSFTSEAPLFVGGLGVASLIVSVGGTVVSGGPAGGANAIVAYNAGGEGVASVDGIGSRWDVTQNLVAGYDGAAYLNVTDGATLEVDGALMRVGRDAGALGDVEIYGTGSTLIAPGAELSLGLDGTGSLWLYGGAAATVGSVLIGGSADSPTASLEIDAGSMLTVRGAFTDGASPNIAITIAGGTLTTASGFDIGNAGGSDAVIVDGSGEITGGIGLGAGATLNFDETAVLGGAITIDGGSLSFAAGSGAGQVTTLANPIVVGPGLGGAQGTITASSSLDLTGGVVFDPPGAPDLLVDQDVALSGGVMGFAAGDTLDLENVFFATLPDTATWANNTLSLSAVQFGGGATLETVAMPGNYATTTFAVNPDAGDGVNVTIACFAQGTRIATLRGEVAVEALRPGDRVRTLTGGAPVVWLGHRRIACDRHPRPRDVMPVRVRREAFAAGQPCRDLLLSPDHAVFVDDLLIPIRRLINGSTIVQEAVAEITYWHVELPRHDVVLAEGLPAESYLDTGNRCAFNNGGPIVNLHADFAPHLWEAEACAPLIVHGVHLEAVRNRLLARAGFGSSPTLPPAGTALAMYE